MGLGKVKKGFNDKYEIKKYEDHVVQDNFKFGDDKEIVSTLVNLFKRHLELSTFNRSWPWTIMS